MPTSKGGINSNRGAGAHLIDVLDKIYISNTVNQSSAVIEHDPNSIKQSSLIFARNL